MIARNGRPFQNARAQGSLHVGLIIKEARIQRAVLVMLIYGLFGVRAEVMAAQCSSYYISEINLVSTDDAEAGHVQTFVGFGPSKEEAEKSALGSCSRIRFS